eukprot:3499081-Amphidinium_carterae.1
MPWFSLGCASSIRWWRLTLWVDGSGRAPNDSPFWVCLWSVVGKGVLIQAKLAGPAQSVYPAELLALVTALQGAEPGALVVFDCKSACRVVNRLWRALASPWELRLLSFPRSGREVKW